MLVVPEDVAVAAVVLACLDLKTVLEDTFLPLRSSATDSCPLRTALLGTFQWL